MALQVNQNELETRVNTAVGKVIQKIIENSQNGISVTEINFEEDIFLKCADKLDEIMITNDIPSRWLDMGGYGLKPAKFKLKQ